MSIIVYGLTQCGTCKKARAWLEQRDLEYVFIDYRENPIAPEQLSAWAQQLGWEKLVNRASMTWRGLPDERKHPAAEQEWLALVEQYPALVRRPVTLQGGEVGVGFSEKVHGQRFE